MEFVKCLQQANFTKEQIDFMLGKRIKTLLLRGEKEQINKTLDLLIKQYEISHNAIQNCLSIFSVRKSS